MIEQLARYVVSWQIKKNYLPKGKENLYTYAYGLLIGQAVNILIACLLAVIFHAYTIVFIYLISYIPLRSYAGGHHARSYGICTIVSSILICFVCIAVRSVPSGYILPVNLIGMLISGGLIFLLAPVEDRNKPLDLEERERYKRRSKGVWLVETALWLGFHQLGIMEAGLTIVLAHLTLSAMLCIGVLKNKYF